MWRFDTLIAVMVASTKLLYLEPG